MWQAGFWGGVGGFALLVGALLGVYTPTSQRLISAIMALGAGVLMSSAAFELMQEAHAKGGPWAASAGLLAGALSYAGANYWLTRNGAQNRKQAKGQQQHSGSTGPAMVLVIGALLDGIPESVAIGTSLLDTHSQVSWAMVAAVFLSNIPESMAASAGMKQDGRPVRQILVLWLIVLLVSALSAALGYAWLQHAPGEVMAVILAYAAGAVITMLASTMLPEAYEGEGALSGLFTTFGFLLAFLLSQAQS